MKRNQVRNILLLIFLITEISDASAQSQNSSGLTHYANTQVFRLKAWTKMSKKEWNDVIYRFPEFQPGRIVLSEGVSPTNNPRLNYNVYAGKIEYMGDNGDTTELKNSSQLKFVTIGDQFFYNNYPNGYIEKINHTPVALGAKHLIKMMYESNNGERFAATDWQQPTSRFDRLYLKNDEYYFIDKHEERHRANLPSILKIYRPTKKEVKRYVKETKVDFKKKEDLIGLLEFCQRFDN